MTSDSQSHVVAVIGAGPAGLFAARQLAAQGVTVALINRDIKPGGLAEYGIYYDKYKMKDGLRKQFRQIMTQPNVHYYGNVTVGQQADVKLADLLSMGFQAVLVTAGAQGTKWLGLPGEHLAGVYHAKDLVYHYNKLPPYAQRPYRVQGRVALVGVGNVMMDIAHWCIHDLKVSQVIAVARRGPAEVKFTKREMEYVAANLDVAAITAEVQRCAPTMQAVGQDVQAALDYLLSGIPKASPTGSPTQMLFDFLASPTAMVGNEAGEVVGLEVEDTTLIAAGSDTKAKGTGHRRVIPCDTVVFCIGDKVDDDFGLPVQWNAFVKNPNPVYPIDGLSYEAFDPQTGAPLDGIFVAGWSREASSGLVGIARKDGENGAAAILRYLESHSPADPCVPIHTLDAALASHRVIRKADVVRIEAAELSQAQSQGLEEFKFTSNEDMLALLNQ
jgi:ferredoxin--NADP+ reductase